MTFHDDCVMLRTQAKRVMKCCKGFVTRRKTNVYDLLLSQVQLTKTLC